MYFYYIVHCLGALAAFSTACVPTHVPHSTVHGVPISFPRSTTPTTSAATASPTTVSAKPVFEVRNQNALSCPQSVIVAKKSIQISVFIFYIDADGKIVGETLGLATDRNQLNSHLLIQTVRTFTGYCRIKAPLCENVDKMIYMFDTDKPHFFQEISVQFPTGRKLSFKFPNPAQCCESSSQHWFGGDTADKRCLRHFKKSPVKNRLNEHAGYYLLGMDSGVEAILNQKEYDQFHTGKLQQKDLNAPCSHVCQ